MIKHFWQAARARIEGSAGAKAKETKENVNMGFGGEEGKRDWMVKDELGVQAIE